MANRSSNRERSRWTIDQLDLRPDHRVLELGPGPGHGLAAIAERTRAPVVAIDHSPVMVAQARRRLRRLGLLERIEVRTGDAIEALAPDERFDRIVAINVAAFWDDPAGSLAALRRRLEPGGRIAITQQPRRPGATERDTDLAERRIRSQLGAAGFDEIVSRRLPLEPPAVCVIGRRPGGDSIEE